MSKVGDGKIGFWAVVAIGVGGMVGGGIFAVLGLAVQMAHGGTPVAFALSEAARSFFGQTGFDLIAVAAMLSTASAINATFYGSARLSYCTAVDGQLLSELERKVWGQRIEGLLITAALTLVVANLFDLTSISTLGSAGFLLIFAAVNFGNARCATETKSRAWISIVGAVACVAALGALVWQTATTAPAKLWVLAAMIAIAVAVEGTYRLVRGARGPSGGSHP